MNYTIKNPYNDEVIGIFNYDSNEDIEEKLCLLKEGRNTQRMLSAHERSSILRRLSELIRLHSEELASLITKETGKTISDSRVEIERAINTAVASSEEARQISGEALDSDAYAPTRRKTGVVCWRPLGTILCITPFNFPINIALHKIGPAFAAGNTILFKPGPQNTLSGRLLTELCYEAGIPTNTIQLCIPDIPQMAKLIAHPTINAINFTGGTEAANSIAEAAGYKRLLLELGGNDPLIVMPDADLSNAVNAAINQRFATAGQRCTAAKRLFVHEAVYPEFKRLLVERSGNLIIGDPTDDNTFVGPVINSRAADEVQDRIQKAIAQGAEVLLGNRRVGNIIYPTILAGVPDDSEIMREETFGPVIPIRQFKELEEIIPVINNTPYGLQAGVFTQQLDQIKALFDALDVGTLAVNDGPGFRAEHFPFGGVKESGVGREGVKYAIREMSYQKTLVF